MTITWLGHACFRIEEDGYAIVLDPYTGVRGYLPLQATGNEVLCSHQHADHNFKEGVMMPLNLRKSPFTVETMATYHDEKQGALRGGNTVHILRCGDRSVVHLGDLGHQLSREQAAKLHDCDVLLIPVGGVYTIDAAGAKAVAEQIKPRLIVPMHYRHEPYGLKNVAGADEFLRLFPQEEVYRLKGSSFSPEDFAAGVVVPRYPE
ncbi:MAG: MBL fold metallo-hydrolase [Clostridiales bacterium]|nr:MBL fold metallo-hydrolase [Candidatus Cacconaster stercorequi]